MNKETYERTMLIVTEFDTEDIIVTSGESPDPGPGPDPGTNPPAFVAGEYEMPVGF